MFILRFWYYFHASILKTDNDIKGFLEQGLIFAKIMGCHGNGLITQGRQRTRKCYHKTPETLVFQKITVRHWPLFGTENLLGTWTTCFLVIMSFTDGSSIGDFSFNYTYCERSGSIDQDHFKRL